MIIPQLEATLEPPTSSLPPTLRRVVLTGFMGAGKSTIGALLARYLGWSFVDLDRHLEQRTGLSVAEIFAQQGEARFRRLESSALATALGPRDTVIALGGGAPETLTNRLLLEQTPGTATVFLDAPFAVLFDRCMLQALDRPNLQDAAAAELRFRLRQPLYKRMARLTVPTAELDPMQTVPVILSGLLKL